MTHKVRITEWVQVGFKQKARTRVLPNEFPKRQQARRFIRNNLRLREWREIHIILPNGQEELYDDSQDNG